MKIIVTVVVVIVQFIIGQLLAFGGAYALSAGNGLELVVFVIGDTLGVWGIGALATKLAHKNYLAPANSAAGRDRNRGSHWRGGHPDHAGDGLHTDRLSTDRRAAGLLSRAGRAPLTE